MLRKIKNISIFVIVTFYVLQFSPLFSDVFIENIKEIRYNAQLSKLHLAETKELSISYWNSLGKKKELKINGVYYDVVSYKKSGNKIIATLVKDSYEDKFKTALEQLFSVKEPINKNKKKIQKSNLVVTIVTSTAEDNTVTESKKYYCSNFREVKGKTNKIVVTNLRPPC
ncbi:hypothetical protein [Flavobacterium sp. GCM10023249]|uniref:hypothetical protein n=1 Tax=unclassified Flavobacterium TaxID=196869 RepID=UPI003617FD77